MEDMTQIDNKKEELKQNIASLQKTLDESIAYQKSLKESHKQLKKDVKEAEKNLRAAQAFLNSLPMEETDEGVAAFEQSQYVVKSWQDALLSRQEALTQNEDSAVHVKDEYIPNLRAQLREAKKNLKSLGSSRVPLSERVIQNEVTQPASGTRTRLVWDIAESMSKELERPVLARELRKEALAQGLSAGTVNTQYSKWCQFHGISVEARAKIRQQLSPRSARQQLPELPVEVQQQSL